MAKEPWHFHNLHMILCPPSVLQNATLESYTLTPFWIQVFRLPFLSKTEALAKILGNMIGKFLEVFEDSLNEGWGPFLRMRVEIDVSKPLLRGQFVTFPWMNDELWIDCRYERLPDFCYECGIIGHVFDKCSRFLEKLDEGVEPNLPYGPWMEGSSLPRSSYDRYRQDFSKEGPWPFLTRLARNTINPILEHPRHLPAAPANATSSEKGKQVLDSTNIIESNIKNLHFLRLTGVSSQSPKRLSVKDQASSSCSKEIPIDKLSPSNNSGFHTPASAIEYPSRSAAISPTVSHITPNLNPSLASTPVATYPPPPPLPPLTSKNQYLFLCQSIQPIFTCQLNSIHDPLCLLPLSSQRLLLQIHHRLLRTVCPPSSPNDNFQPQEGISNGIEPDQRVSSLITSARQWDLEVLNASFLASDVDKILQIPLPIFPAKDTLIWHFETNGAYTVKTVKRRRTQVEGYDVGLMEEQPMNGDYGQFGPGSVGLSVCIDAPFHTPLLLFSSLRYDVSSLPFASFWHRGDDLALKVNELCLWELIDVCGVLVVHGSYGLTGLGDSGGRKYSVFNGNKANASPLGRLGHSLGFFNAVIVEPLGSIGGLCLCWKAGIQIDLISSSLSSIEVKFNNVNQCCLLVVWTCVVLALFLHGLMAEISSILS
ncbi:hypothetical protein F8388_026204 [Cannabis sativa]|uniref:Zinc knuckle CX2CX4HX4C domain-containing protein n=1 Tax=Cannabis sativa TaxID=3483 RepID=A0A7J6FRL2_CANSA|nr:hypothetical protein F8388_026204 [Cannabis sativa]